jgi:DNA-binding MarR family transcriptional regulator
MESLNTKALKLSAYLWNLNQRFEKLQGGISHTSCDLTSVETKAVELLGSRGVCRMAELAGQLGLAVSSATALVDRLETKGQVIRRRDDEDRRVVMVQLSPEGQDAFNQCADTYIRFCRDMLSKLSETEQDRLLALFKKIVAERE